MIHHTLSLTKNWSRFAALFPLALILVFFTACENAAPTDEADGSAPETTEATPPARIVSLDGSVTELLFSLGLGDQIIGVDVTSTYPADSLVDVPRLGHVSQINVEALLALAPDLLFVDAERAEAPQIVQVAEAGVKVVPLELTSRLDNALAAARQIEAHLPLPPAPLERMRKSITSDTTKLNKKLTELPAEKRPRVVFIYARGTGRVMVAGSETEAAKLIDRCGGINAVTDFENFEALTPEALIAAAPDIVLMFTSGLESLDGVDGLAQIPGFQETPAFRNERILALDGHYLLGFGPRAGRAANELADYFLKFANETSEKAAG